MYVVYDVCTADSEYVMTVGTYIPQELINVCNRLNTYGSQSLLTTNMQHCNFMCLCKYKYNKPDDMYNTETITVSYFYL